MDDRAGVVPGQVFVGRGGGGRGRILGFHCRPGEPPCPRVARPARRLSEAT